MTSGLLKTGEGMRSYSSHSRQMIIYSSRGHHLARSENEELEEYYSLYSLIWWIYLNFQLVLLDLSVTQGPRPS